MRPRQQRRTDRCEVCVVGPEHLPGAQALMRHDANLSMDLANSSLVLLAEHLGHGRILSTDERELRAYRWKRHRPFDNLLC